MLELGDELEKDWSQILFNLLRFNQKYMGTMDNKYFLLIT